MKDPGDWKWFGLIPILLAVGGAVYTVVTTIATRLKETHEWWMGFVAKVEKTDKDLQAHLAEIKPGLDRMHEMKERIALAEKAIEYRSLQAADDKRDFVDLVGAIEERVMGAIHEVRDDIRTLIGSGKKESK